MRILKRIKAFIKGLILQLFPSMGPKGVINTQIVVYKKLKKKFPNASENEILNSLIVSRIKAPFSPSSRSEEILHYEIILNNDNKTIEDVIWAIVEYEYILSRGDQLHKDLVAIGTQPSKVIEEIERWLNYIKESVKRMK